MPFTTLISAPQLQSLMHSGQPLMVFDCSFDLGDPALGARQYREAHVRGALYADLDKHLSAQHGAPGAHGSVVTSAADQPASGGRHPLPSRERFATWLSRIGFANDMQAVVYDRNGANYCGRLWWMLRWAGHDAVAVLDGGLQAWQAAGGAVNRPGRAAGNRMRRTRRRRLKPYICPTSTSLRSMSRIAATPLTYTGKNAPIAISTIFEVSSMPSHSSNNGTQARLGIERSPAKVGSR